MSRVSSSITPAFNCLSHGRGPAGDVHTALTGGLTGCGVRRVEALSDEVEGRPPVHLDRIMAVMGQHEDRRVIGRFSAPPAGPFLVQSPRIGPNILPTHHVRAPRAHGPLVRDLVGLIGPRVADMPTVQLPPPLPQRVLPALIRSGDEAVQRDRHVAGGVRHREPPGWLRLSSGRADAGSPPTGGSAARPSVREPWKPDHPARYCSDMFAHRIPQATQGLSWVLQMVAPPASSAFQGTVPSRRAATRPRRQRSSR